MPSAPNKLTCTQLDDEETLRGNQEPVDAPLLPNEPIK